MKNGTWRDTSSLEMGTGSKKSKKCRVKCPNCYDVRLRSINCIGVICATCNKYFSINANMQDVDCGTVDRGGLSVHVVNKELVEFRDGMEEKAYAFKDRQLKRKENGQAPVRHGSLDPETNKRRL